MEARWYYAHDILVQETGFCPWCGSEYFGMCSDPCGQDVVSEDWPDQ